MKLIQCGAFLLSFAYCSVVLAEYVPVSLAPVANQVHERILGMPTGLQTLGGVPFDLLPGTSSNSWAAEVGTTAGVQSVESMTLNVSIFGATAVDTLINTSWGYTDSNTVSVSFVGTGGASYSVNLVGGVDIRDWVDGAYTNTINGTTSTEVFTGVPNRPFGTLGRIDKQTIALPISFASETLTSITFTDSGVSGNDDVSFTQSVGGQRAFLYGVTVTTVPEPSAYLMVAWIVCCALSKRHRSV